MTTTDRLLSSTNVAVSSMARPLGDQRGGIICHHIQGDSSVNLHENTVILSTETVKYIC